MSKKNKCIDVALVALLVAGTIFLSWLWFHVQPVSMEELASKEPLGPRAAQLEPGMTRQQVWRLLGGEERSIKVAGTPRSDEDIAEVMEYRKHGRRLHVFLNRHERVLFHSFVDGQ